MTTRALSSSIVILCAALAAGCAGQATSGNGVGSGPHIHLDGGSCGVGTTSCSGKCVNLLSDDSNCGRCGALCGLGSTCQGGSCTSSGNCTGTQTNCGGSCTDVNSDVQNCGSCGNACADGQACIGGNCASPPGGDGGTGCPGTQAMCGGVCVDTRSDPANCGACGTACQMGQTCTAGACVAVMGAGDAGVPNAGGAGCADTVTCLNNCNDANCQQMCVNAASANGKALLKALLGCIDMACPSTGGGVCDASGKKYNAASCDACLQQAQGMGGKCVAQLDACIADVGGGGGCAMGQTSCAGACVDVTTDAANCGACGKACAMGQTCKAGVCSGGGCAMGLTSCGGRCVNTQTSTTNCGACGKACSRGQSCKAGVCTGCPVGQTSCGGKCVDLTSDAANCGACGNACAMGQACMAGVCAGGGGMTGCNGAVACLNGCGDLMCEQDCVNNTTMLGQQLLNSLLTCIDNACPSTGGGVCDAGAKRFSQAACDQCVADAQARGGACRADLNACLANGP